MGLKDYICQWRDEGSKEKKKSFIKEWQKDLKEFFSLRKKKSSVENNEVTQETENEGKEIESDYKEIEVSRNGLNATDVEIFNNGNSIEEVDDTLEEKLVSNEPQAKVETVVSTE